MKSSGRKLALFGATGSIGRQTLDVVEKQGGYRISVLSAGKNVSELTKLAMRWRPEIVTLADDNGYSTLKTALEGTGIKIIAGEEAAAEAAADADYDLSLNGLVGVAGLLPSHYTLLRGKDLALANKESLVLAGALLNRIAESTGARILPVDSEHSAIQQCLLGEDIETVSKMILTASGGPFREWDKERIYAASPEDALQHPTWKMGPKITIDSATLMNKGLEIIEAFHLFEIPLEKIVVRIHPVSVVHSMVEFVDGSFKAQLGTPDMRHPIQYALNLLEREPFPHLDDDPVNWLPLEFFAVDHERFPCLNLAYRALDEGGTATAILNGADEAAIRRFLTGDIVFGQIYTIIDEALKAIQKEPADTVEKVLQADRQAREFVMKMEL